MVHRCWIIFEHTHTPVESLCFQFLIRTEHLITGAHFNWYPRALPPIQVIEFALWNTQWVPDFTVVIFVTKLFMLVKKNPLPYFHCSFAVNFELTPSMITASSSFVNCLSEIGERSDESWMPDKSTNSMWN